MPAPTRRGRASRPARHTLRLLLAPMMSSFVLAHEEQSRAVHGLGDGLDGIAARVETLEAIASRVDALAATVEALVELLARLEAGAARLDTQGDALEHAHLRLDALTDDVAAAGALAWDQVALARRLAALEERGAESTA